MEVTVDRAWQELESLKYDWGESPQSFTHKFICQHAMIATKFPYESFPDRDKTIKRKLWQGLPPSSKEKLEGFLDEGYPLKKFIDRLEHERRILEMSHAPQVNMVPTHRGQIEKPPGKPADPQPSSHPERTAGIKDTNSRAQG